MPKKRRKRIVKRPKKLSPAEAQAISAAIFEKLTAPSTAETQAAADAVGAYVKAKMKEESFLFKILPPIPVTAEDIRAWAADSTGDGDRSNGWYGKNGSGDGDGVVGTYNQFDFYAGDGIGFFYAGDGIGFGEHGSRCGEGYSADDRESPWRG